MDKCQVCGKYTISGIKICTDCQVIAMQKGKKIEMKSDYIKLSDNKFYLFKKRIDTPYDYLLP